MPELAIVATVLEVLSSPVGPALVLLAGAATEMVIGRWVRRAGWLTGIALGFLAVAVWLFLDLRVQPIVPTFSRPWQPPLQTGTNLVWVGDGWNWYVSGLLLLLGGIGIMLDLSNSSDGTTKRSTRHAHSSLAVHLAVLAAGLLFVGSGNVLTTMLTWVLLDLIIILRGAVQTELSAPGTETLRNPQHQARGLSLLGALLLLIGLLPAGPLGPSQALSGGVLPPETAGLMLLAALIRAGIYPFHLWLLPSGRQRVPVSDRLLDHMVPVLCGIWLLGWTVALGSEYIHMQPDIIALLTLSLLGSSVAAWTAKEQTHFTTFVLVTSAGMVALTGTLAFSPGPEGLIWPATAFALGGALWLVGEEVYQLWGWQIPVSVGALALAGVPFTPGFLTQPSLARLLRPDPLFLALFGAFVVAQSFQIAALLRSWSDPERQSQQLLQPGAIVRLMAATIALAVPLATFGFFPRVAAGLASMQNAIPPMLGNPPSVVAEMPVWIAVSAPLALGIGLVIARPALWGAFGGLFDKIGVLARLEWLFQFSWWVIDRISDAWGQVLRLVEGAGYVGWVAVFLLLGYFLVR
ncbi:MAG: hypothetical protein ACK2UO_22995 [Caldilineaceae bacterium]